ncbi:thioredoxin [Hydrogenovibrio crunogenus]|uniref:Thioredoxin n=2 Tax=Hydrogenovibrio crunogenus TaxID=39765 RepID=A0A4V1C8N5_9GAMM|nr:thioredoxin [Hydrogenovibrio crunogenus]RUM92803.1 MAG: thioredoxin [Thiomicrospira sp.]
MKKWALILGLLGSLFFSVNTMAADFFDETFGNLQEELETARDEGKQGIFIFFHMEECPFCDRMKKTILNQPEVIAFYKKHFLTYQIDIEGANQMVDFDGTEATAQTISEKKYRVRATPVMMIFDLNGQPIVRYTGPTRTQKEFMLLGQFVLDGSYKTTSFTRYKRAHK